MEPQHYRSDIITVLYLFINVVENVVLKVDEWNPKLDPIP